MLNRDLAPGDLLIAPPSMQDSRFARSVIMLTSVGMITSGFVLNRATDHSVNDLVSKMNLDLDEEIPVYWGGPVSPNTVWMLHDPDWQHDQTVQINEHWSATSHLSMFHHINDGDRPQRFRVFIGCASWAPGQLDHELEGTPPWTQNSSWLTVHRPDPDCLLDSDGDDLWTQATGMSRQQAVDQWIP